MLDPTRVLRVYEETPPSLCNSLNRLHMHELKLLAKQSTKMKYRLGDIQYNP